MAAALFRCPVLRPSTAFEFAPVFGFEARTHAKQRLINPVDIVIVELKKIKSNCSEPTNPLEEWIWFLAHYDIEYTYKDLHVLDAAEQIKAILSAFIYINKAFVKSGYETSQFSLSSGK
jgi:hypothetical protein